MLVRKIVFVIASLLGMAVGSANAQSDARIRLVIPSIHQVEEDLQWLIELSPTADLKKQWKKLKEEVLDAFTQGVDEAKPIELDLVFRKDELSYEYRLPVTKLKDIIASIEGMGFKFKTLANDSFYQFAEKNKKPYFLRFDKNYAWIASQQNAIPATPGNALQEMQPLLNLNKDLVAELKNDAAGIEGRRTNFRELRKQFEALIKYNKNVDKSVFELKKMVQTHQLDEAERFVVESENLQVNWTTSSATAKPTGRGEFSLTALPNTDLAKSIEQFAVNSSYFANVPLHDKALVVGKTTFPLDDLRVHHLKEFFKAVRPIMETEIGKQEKTDSQKTALKSGMNKFMDLLDSSLSLGVMDSFMDCHPLEAGKNVLVGGVRVADGKAADEIIKLLPEINPEWKTEPGEEHGGVAFHKVTLPKTRLESFQRIFAGETAVLIGTSKDAVWIAAGADAVNHLKIAIDKTKEPAPEKVSPIIMSYQIQVAKLITLLEIVEKESPALNTAKPTKEQALAQKEIEKYRKLAQDTMGNCESLWKGELIRNGNKIEGYLELNECVLRYIGATLADKVKSTLQ